MIGSDVFVENKKHINDCCYCSPSLFINPDKIIALSLTLEQLIYNVNIVNKQLPIQVSHGHGSVTWNCV